MRTKAPAFVDDTNARGEDARATVVLPVVLVLLTLVALVIVPHAVERRNRVLWREIADVAEPARIILGDLQLALAREMANVRGYALSGDPRHVARYRELLTEERLEIDRLGLLMHRLGPEAGATHATLREAAAAWHARSTGSEMLAGTLDRETYAARIPDEEPLWEALMFATDATRDAIVEREAELRAEIHDVERTGLFLTSGLALLALLAALSALRIGRRFERLRGEAERGRRELRVLLEARARLIRAITHDVRNPLSAVQGYGELLEGGILGPLTERQTNAVERIRTAADAALTLVQDLLELSMTESGELLLVPGPTDVGEQVEAALGECGPAADEADLRVSAEVPEDLPRAEADPRRVRQILWNLMSNAIKYTPGGGRVRVDAAARSGGSAPGRGRWIAIDVADTGPGIPPDRQEEIFEEFSRLEPGTERGTGLGLAVSRKLARAMGGDVTVASAPGRGSTFTLWLPIHRPERGDDSGREAA